MHTEKEGKEVYGQGKVKKEAETAPVPLPKERVGPPLTYGASRCEQGHTRQEGLGNAFL